MTTGEYLRLSGRERGRAAKRKERSLRSPLSLQVTGSPSSVPISHPSISGSGLVPSTGAALQHSYRNGQRDGGQLDLAQVAAEYGADEVYQENHQLDQDLSAERRGGGEQGCLCGGHLRARGQEGSVFSSPGGSFHPGAVEGSAGRGPCSSLCRLWSVQPRCSPPGVLTSAPASTSSFFVSSQKLSGTRR